MIKAKVIADSKNEFGNRITTMVITFPRIILAEFNTHRMFSRNSASSRAIPFEKMLKSVEENPFIPIAWQKDHKGMQGSEYFTEPKEIGTATGEWLVARNYAIQQAKVLSSLDCTKQLCNRLLEPFMYHTVIVTATEWENFFSLRCPKYEHFPADGEPKYFRSKVDWLKYCKENCTQGVPKEMTEHLWQMCNKGQAEIHMMALAEAMWDAYNESTPKELKEGEWHIPFGDEIPSSKLIPYLHSKEIPENKDQVDKALTKITTAMCARVSYTVVGEEGKEPNYENDIKLHDRLAESGHWSPFEHSAQAMKEEDTLMNAEYPGQDCKYHNGVSGNFKGFIQYRKMFNNENITKNE
jgi:thymidylate synthase ThyX